MVFEFLGDKKKIVIAMAHIGALPGSPLYDTDGGVNKLIEGVLKDIEALQDGRRRRRDVRQRERPPLRPQGAA